MTSAELYYTGIAAYWSGLAFDGSFLVCEGALRDKVERLRYNREYCIPQDELRQLIGARLSLRKEYNVAWVE